MKKILTFIFSILFVCASLFACYQSTIETIYYTGKLHGVEMQDKSLKDIENEIALSPIDNSTEAKILYDSGKLSKNLYFYRTDCPDCQREFSSWTIEQYREMQTTTLFVCTRTDAGRYLVKEFNITEVPHLVQF